MLLASLLIVGSLQLLAIAQPFLVLGAVIGYTFQLSGLLELDLLALTCPGNGRYLSGRIQLLN